MIRKALHEFDEHLAKIGEHYEKSAPCIDRWADDLCVRLASQADKVVLTELLFAESLLDEGVWQQPNYAQNSLYKLLTRLGRDTTGMSDF